METMSKGEFAAHIGVSPGRISQYIDAGHIGADALVGEGRSARIDVARAIEQIRSRRHIGQSLGNGLATHLRLVPTAAADQVGGENVTGAADTTPPPLKREPDAAELIQIERLASERRKNRMAAVEEARTLGALVEAEAVEREVGKAVQATLNIFTGMAPDLANAIAAKFSLPQRDVLHLIRQVMNERRGAAAAQFDGAAASLPETKEAVIE